MWIANRKRVVSAVMFMLAIAGPCHAQLDVLKRLGEREARKLIEKHLTESATPAPEADKQLEAASAAPPNCTRVERPAESWGTVVPGKAQAKDLGRIARFNPVAFVGPGGAHVVWKAPDGLLTRLMFDGRAVGAHDEVGPITADSKGRFFVYWARDGTEVKHCVRGDRIAFDWVLPIKGASLPTERDGVSQLGWSTNNDPIVVFSYGHVARYVNGNAFGTYGECPAAEGYGAHLDSSSGQWSAARDHFAFVDRGEAGTNGRIVTESGSVTLPFRPDLRGPTLNDGMVPLVTRDDSNPKVREWTFWMNDRRLTSVTTNKTERGNALDTMSLLSDGKSWMAVNALSRQEGRAPDGLRLIRPDAGTVSVQNFTAFVGSARELRADFRSDRYAIGGVSTTNRRGVVIVNGVQHEIAGDRVPEPFLLGGGSWAAIGSTQDRAAVFHNGTQVAASSPRGLGKMRRSSDGARFAISAHDDEGEWLITDDVRFGPYERIGAYWFGGTGSHLAAMVQERGKSPVLLLNGAQASEGGGSNWLDAAFSGDGRTIVTAYENGVSIRGGLLQIAARIEQGTLRVNEAGTHCTFVASGTVYLDDQRHGGRYAKIVAGPVFVASDDVSYIGVRDDGTYVTISFPVDDASAATSTSNVTSEATAPSERTSKRDAVGLAALSGDVGKHRLSEVFAYSPSGSFLAAHFQQSFNSTVCYVRDLYFNGERVSLDEQENATPIDQRLLGAISDDGRQFAVPLEVREGAFEGHKVRSVLYVFGKRIVLGVGEDPIGVGMFAPDSSRYFTLVRRSERQMQPGRIMLMTVSQDGSQSLDDLRLGVGSSERAAIKGMFDGEPFVAGSGWATLGSKPVEGWAGTFCEFLNNSFYDVIRKGSVNSVNINGITYSPLGNVKSISFSQNGKRHGLITESATEHQQLELRIDGQVVARPFSATRVRFSPNGTHTAFGKTEMIGERKWEHFLTLDGRDIKVPGKVFDVAIANNGDYILSSGGYYYTEGDSPKSVSGSTGWTFEGYRAKWLGASSEGNRLAAVCIAGNAGQPESCRVIVDGKELPRAYDDAGCVTFSPDGSHYAVAVKRKSVWTLVVDGQEVATTAGKPLVRNRESQDDVVEPRVDPLFVNESRVRWFFEEDGQFKRFDYLVEVARATPAE